MVPKLAEATGASVTAVRQWASGKTEPHRDYLVALANALDVSLVWLATGQGPQRVTAEENVSATLPERESPIGKHGATTYKEVPRYDVTLAAGHGSFVERAPLLDHIPFTQTFLRRKLGRSSTDGLVILDARGDSMEPTIGDGDLVMVDTNTTDLQGGVMAFVLDDVAYIKRVRILMEGGVEIRSDNAEVYPPERLSGDRLGDLQVLGRVRWVGKVI